MNISGRKRILRLLFAFLIDFEILAWPFAFCIVQSHESLIRGSKEKHRTVYSLSLHQFPARASIQGPGYRPSSSEMERALLARCLPPVYCPAPPRAVRGATRDAKLWGFPLGDVRVLLQLIASICF